MSSPSPFSSSSSSSQSHPHSTQISSFPLSRKTECLSSHSSSSSTCSSTSSAIQGTRRLSLSSVTLTPTVLVSSLLSPQSSTINSPHLVKCFSKLTQTFQKGLAAFRIAQQPPPSHDLIPLVQSDQHTPQHSPSGFAKFHQTGTFEAQLPSRSNTLIFSKKPPAAVTSAISSASSSASPSNAASAAALATAAVAAAAVAQQHKGKASASSAALNSSSSNSGQSKDENYDDIDNDDDESFTDTIAHYVHTLQDMTLEEAIEQVKASYASRRNLIFAGLFSGCTVAGVFNPWDRALYLSQLYKRPFLHRDNFQNPYRGIWQVVFHRTLSNGMFFPLFDLFKPLMQKYVVRHDNHRPQDKHLSADARCALVAFLSGNTAGAVSGIITNHFTAIKYASWDSSHGFLRTSLKMWREGGFHPFFKGVAVTVARDTLWGGCFALLKYTINASTITNTDTAVVIRMKSLFASLVGGTIATMISAPFNYARNMKYGTPASERPKSTWTILKDLRAESKHYAKGVERLSFLQHELRLGWGTARVAVGMAVGSELYEWAKTRLDDLDKNHQIAALHKKSTVNSTPTASANDSETKK